MVSGSVRLAKLDMKSLSSLARLFESSHECSNIQVGVYIALQPDSSELLQLFAVRSDRVAIAGACSSVSCTVLARSFGLWALAV